MKGMEVVRNRTIKKESGKLFVSSICFFSWSKVYYEK